MITWVCIKCANPVEEDRIGWWCSYCDDDTAAVEVAEPEPASPGQRATIRYLYAHHGLHPTTWCLQDISRRLGRTVTGYPQLTTTEAAHLIPALKEWSHGVR